MLYKPVGKIYDNRQIDERNKNYLHKVFKHTLNLIFI